MQVTLSHEIVLPFPVDRVFPLFTPRGEMDWLAEWRPDFIDPPDGETCEGMVFRTGHGGEETLWACIDWKPQSHEIRYARVTPASRFGLLRIDCRAMDPITTAARITYAYTALTPEGERLLAEMSQERMAGMVEGWGRLMGAWLGR